MTPQIDGNATLNQQELQLQSLESFFMEVVDYQDGAGGLNDVLVKSVSAPPSPRLNLALLAPGESLLQIATKANRIVFDNRVLVEGKLSRVVGFRK